MCNHDKGFLPLACHTEDLPPMVWACIERCGFWLNFDPAYAGKHRSAKWSKFIISYSVREGRNIPGKQREWKPAPKMILPGP